MIPLLALALLARQPSPALIDRAIAEQVAALDAATAPLVRLRATAARLERAPPPLLGAQSRGRERLARIAALAAILGPEIATRTAARRHAIVSLAALRLRLCGALPPRWNGSSPYRLPARARAAAAAPDPADLALVTGSGAVVVAPAAARITFAAPFRRYGGVIVLDHGHGWTSILTGLGTIGVHAGQRMSGGAPLGRMPAGAPVLVTELRRHGRIVDVARMAAAPG